MTTTETTPTTLAEVEQATLRLSRAYDELSELTSTLQSEIDAVKRRHIRRLRTLVSDNAQHTKTLVAMIESAPGLFIKPRTYVFHGFKVGMQGKKPAVEIPDPDKTVTLIKRHFPDEAERLINTKETPDKSSLQYLSLPDLRRIGCTMSKPTDAVVCKPVAGDLEKVIKSLLDDALEQQDPESEEEQS